MGISSPAKADDVRNCDYDTESYIGTFTQALYDQAKKQGWTIISMKNDWKRIFAFEQ